MTHRLLVVAISLGCLLAVDTAWAGGDTDTAKKLVGTYSILGMNPPAGPASYKATATIAHIKGDVVLITYKYTNNKIAYVGLGKIIEGNKLRVTYELVGTEGPPNFTQLFNVRPNGLSYENGAHRETWKKK